MSIKAIVILSVIGVYVVLLAWANLTSEDQEWSEGTGEDDMYP